MPVKDVGCLLVAIRSTGFKVALIVGKRTSRSRGKYLIRVWRAASSQWTQPMRVADIQLRHVTDDDLDKHGATILRASSAAVDGKLVRRCWT